MSSIEFVKKLIEEYLIKNYPQLSIVYKYDEIHSIHYIQLSQKNLMMNDTKINDVMMEMDIKFIEKFPFESLEFIDSDKI